MDALPYSEGLEYLHCVYFDNGVEVERINLGGIEKSLLSQVLKLKEKKK